MEEVTVKTCIICDAAKENGIEIISHFICEDCEAEMVRTNTEEAKYRFFVGRMKQIVMPNNA